MHVFLALTLGTNLQCKFPVYISQLHCDPACWYQLTKYTNNSRLTVMDGDEWRKTKNPLIVKIGAGFEDFFGRN
jgi:hypothetical protein